MSSSLRPFSLSRPLLFVVSSTPLYRLAGSYLTVCLTRSFPRPALLLFISPMPLLFYTTIFLLSTYLAL
ncbi:hypothetical protein EDB84DRAFT_1487390, partial [Lactarius hengduanensis]